VEILFTNTSDFSNIEKPKPAKEFIPDWYKTMDSYVGKEKKPNGNGITTATIKRCMPVFDAITAGYIITLPADVYVSIENNEQHFQWSDHDLVQFHPIEQAPTHPNKKPHAYPKWMNPWSIKTPKGYSVLFVQPFHRESVFTILPAIVDTDTYYAPVNFPMTINDPNFEGLISVGTPIAQVIPFKRENWKMVLGDNEDIKAQYEIRRKLQTKFFDRYKTLFREKKEYS
jgi:hypothetical protein